MADGWLHLFRRFASPAASASACSWDFTNKCGHRAEGGPRSVKGKCTTRSGSSTIGAAARATCAAPPRSCLLARKGAWVMPASVSNAERVAWCVLSFTPSATVAVALAAEAVESAATPTAAKGVELMQGRLFKREACEKRRASRRVWRVVVARESAWRNILNYPDRMYALKQKLKLIEEGAAAGEWPM
eukprot:g361.t1